MNIGDMINKAMNVVEGFCGLFWVINPAKTNSREIDKYIIN